MTNHELREACMRRNQLTLVLPPPNGRGETRRLCGRQGPRGRIVSETVAGQVVLFKSKDMLKHLDKMEAAETGKENSHATPE